MNQMLQIHKLADKSTGERIVRFDPETGQKKLVNPATDGDAHEPWPLAGVELLERPPLTAISTSKLQEGIAEGWITAQGARPVVRPAGPTQDVWNSTVSGQPHVFIHYDRIVFHTIDGDVAYRVVRQPDKYADYEAATYPERLAAFDGDDDTPVTPDVYAAGATRVDHFYLLELEA